MGRRKLCLWWCDLVGGIIVIKSMLRKTREEDWTYATLDGSEKPKAGFRTISLEI